MSFPSRIVAALSAFILLANGIANAQISLDIEDVVIDAGDASVQVDVIASSPVGDSILGTDLPLDFGGDGIGVPVGLVFEGFSTPFEGSSATGASASNDELLSLFNLAFIGQSPIDLPSTIATLNFAVDDSLAPGTVFAIDFTNTGSLTATNQDSVNVLSGFSGGSITVASVSQTVPEPGSLAILLACGGVALTRRKRN